MVWRKKDNWIWSIILLFFRGLAGLSTDSSLVAQCPSTQRGLVLNVKNWVQIFVLWDSNLCLLVISMRHRYWWRNMFWNNCSLSAFLSLILLDPWLWNVAEGCTFLQSWAPHYLQGVTFSLTFLLLCSGHSFLCSVTWESHLEGGQVQTLCRPSLKAQTALGSW